jgi:hypothetical protein
VANQFRCGRCAGWLCRPASGAAVVACDRCGHRNVCPAPSDVEAPAPPRAQPASSSLSAWPWTAGGCLLIVVACAGWFVYGTRTARASDAAPANPADRRQQELLKQNLDRPGDPELASLYQAINAKHFAGALPVTPVRWEPALAEVGALAEPPYTLEGMFGRGGRRTIILLNPAVRETPGSIERALCHEMVHAYLFARGDSATTHGARFKMELRRLADAGAFEGIAATDDEKAALKAWLDTESARIHSEPAEPEAIDHFNREVARYNLMIVYPDGFDEAPAARPTPSGPNRPAPGAERIQRQQ